MDERKPSDEAARIVVRLPDGMRDRLAARAKASGRSSNAEAVLALEAWLGREETTSAPADYIVPAPTEARFRMIIGEALNEALANPDLLRRFRQLDDLKKTRTDLTHVEAEDGRQFGPQDRLADADEVQGSREFVYPPLVDSNALSPEDRKVLERERAERIKIESERLARKRAKRT